MSFPPDSYAVLIAARNEESTLSVTLECLAGQSIPPSACLVASDSSTDRTDALVQERIPRYPWLSLLRIQESRSRGFASKIAALNTGLDLLPLESTAVVALLDADVRFENTFVEKLLQKFRDRPRLGVAGGAVIDVGTTAGFPRRPESPEVAGAAFFIRVECLRQVRPLPEIPEGGFDTVTLAKARIRGFDTVAFHDLVVDHLKPRGCGTASSTLTRHYSWGLRDYAVGNHPLYQILKCAARFRDRPVLLASVFRAAAFFTATLSRRPRVISPDLVRAIRAEQVSSVADRLRRAVGKPSRRSPA